MALFGRLKVNILFPTIQKYYRNFLKTAVILFSSLLLVCCHTDSKEKVTTTPAPLQKQRVPVPSFNTDSAYSFIKTQVDFGPRIPGSAAHAACANYLVEKLKSYQFETIVQKGTVQTFDKKKFSLKNIIASFNPEARSRILICSHWDTRPWADEDSGEYASKPFDGANDGASGVGIGLEIARQINLSNPTIGVDIAFFDLEDYGDPDGDDKSWCLGSRYWSSNLHTPDYAANFGILLDMVGNSHAIFPKEKQSVDFAATAVDKVWKTAAELGYSNFFVPEIREHVGTDDHIFVNRAGIPCMDIIEYDPKTGGFGDYHHTRKDNMDLIDKQTLKAVGQTLLQVIYTEN